MIAVEVIEDGNICVLKNKNIEAFRKMNVSVRYPFGESAKRIGPSPVTLRVLFMDGNTCTFRGDRASPWVNIMLQNLLYLLSNYIRGNKIKTAIIYDNRLNCLSKKVIEYKDGIVYTNYVEVFLTDYKLKQHDKSTAKVS